MPQILLDTSFLLRMAERSLSTLATLEHRYGPCRFTVLDAVLDELRALAGSRSMKQAKRAKLALEYATQLPTLPSSSTGSVDARLLHTAIEQSVWVATLDRTLRATLRRHGVPVVTLRQDAVWVNGPTPP